MRVEGLNKSTHYNGSLGHVEMRLERGRYCVVMEQGVKVLSLKGDNLMPFGTSTFSDKAARGEVDEGGG